ncbi:hypothetical protein FACS1894211_01130 [Clostridia bacterium]|nr:hypothetical protein FACS1894211_01130 [Clostridia bacterium]
MGIAVIYFDNETKNIHAKLPLDKWYAQRLARRLYRDAMPALAKEYQNRSILLQALADITEFQKPNNTQSG